MAQIRNCGNCAHFEACDFILKRYSDYSGINKDAQACGYYTICLDEIIGDNYDIGRLRELAMADREGRCIILPAGSGDGHADPSGGPGEEGPPGLGPLHPVFERRQQ